MITTCFHIYDSKPPYNKSHQPLIHTMAPPHTAATNTSQASGGPTVRKGPVILSRIPFKARLTPPPAFNCSDENMIRFYVRLQEEEAIKRLRLKQTKIREKFRLKTEGLLEKLREEKDEYKTLDGVSKSLASMEIDGNLLKEEEKGRSQQGCNVLLREDNKERPDTTTQDDDMKSRIDMSPYGDHQPLIKPNVVMKYGAKENEESYPPPSRGHRKDIGVTPRSTFPPPTKRTKPNEDTKNMPEASDTRYSLFTLEQDLATPANIEEFIFKQPPLCPLRPTVVNSVRLNTNISHFEKSGFPSRSSSSSSSSTLHTSPETPSNKIMGRSHSPGHQQRSSFFFSYEPYDSEKENLDELAVHRQQHQQHFLSTPPATPTATTATSKAKPNPYISSSSAPCSPTGRKRARDVSSDDLVRCHSPYADMTMKLEPQVKRPRLVLSPPPRLESSKPLPLLRDSKGLFGPQSLVLR